jgi:hypothetical protein
MNKKIAVVTLFCALTVSVSAQIKLQHSNYKRGITLAYNSYNFSNAGVKIGEENYVAKADKLTVVGGLFLNLLQSKKDFFALGVQATIGQRYTNKWGLMLETQMGIGIQRTTYSSLVYDISKNPITESIVKSSKFNINPNIGFGLGYDFTKKTALPLLAFVRPTINWVFPDRNTVFKTYPALEIGVNYFFRIK